MAYDADGNYLKSLGRADYWRSTGLSEVPATAATPWQDLTIPAAAGHTFATFQDHSLAPTGYNVLASASSWSAIALRWAHPQTDEVGHVADLYLVYRGTPGTPPVNGPTNTVLVGTVEPAPGVTEVTFTDAELERNTSYQYEIVPIYRGEYPDAGSAVSISDSVTTDIY